MRKATDAKKQAYSGFELEPETEKDGWAFGSVFVYGTDQCSCPPGGCISGDGFVQAPDGSRAGVIWEVGSGKPKVVADPNDETWGVYAVYFPKPVNTAKDLAEGFWAALPYLKAMYEGLKIESRR